MTSTTAETTFTQEGFEAFLQTRNEPEWLLEMRRDAWQNFSQMSWPTQREEEWMRTDIRLFNLNKFHLPAGDTSESQAPPALLLEGVDPAGRCVSLDSRTQLSECNQEYADKGVIFGSLSNLASEHAELLKPHLMKAAFDPSFDRFAALHAACFSGGPVLYVPRGVVVDKPFHVLAGMTDGGIDLGHTLVILEEGAEATLLYESASGDESHGGLHCGAVELVVAPGANLRYVNLQNWGRGVWHFGHQKATIGRDSNLQWTIGAMGARLAKVNQHVEMTGAGANCQVNGVMFTEGKQHLSYHTLQHHKAESCRSDFLYKAALQDTSRTVWRGMIKVDNAAQKTDGYQRNDNLLLSRIARADAIPGLEIEADDVRCTHGSTSGFIDEELIFYAECRGFTREEAIRAIVTGFFQQVFDRISIESVRDALSLAVARRVRDYK